MTLACIPPIISRKSTNFTAGKAVISSPLIKKRKEPSGLGDLLFELHKDQIDITYGFVDITNGDERKQAFLKDLKDALNAGVTSIKLLEELISEREKYDKATAFFGNDFVFNLHCWATAYDRCPDARITLGGLYGLRAEDKILRDNLTPHPTVSGPAQGPAPS